jgi:hypothetical protein
MGMCERRPAVDDISSRRVRDRERPLCILHTGFPQFERGVRPGPVGGPRVPGLLRIVINVVGTRVLTVPLDIYAVHHLAILDKAGTLLKLEIRRSLIR